MWMLTKDQVSTVQVALRTKLTFMSIFQSRNFRQRYVNFFAVFRQMAAPRLTKVCSLADDGKEFFNSGFKG